MKKIAKRTISRTAPKPPAAQRPAGTPEPDVRAETPTPTTSRSTEDTSEQVSGEPLKKPERKRAGAALFVPPQKPSGFGGKKG